MKNRLKTAQNSRGKKRRQEMKINKTLFVFLVSVLTAGCVYAAKAGEANDEESMQSDNEVINVQGESGASAKDDAAGNTLAPAGKKIFAKSGALEKKDGDKYILMRKSGSLEFYINGDTKIYLKEQGGPSQAARNNFIAVKGPRNKNAILANTVYVFKDKALYEGYIEKTFKDMEEVKRFDSYVRGTVYETGSAFGSVDEKMRPLLVTLEDGTRVMLCYDEDTYWAAITRAGESDIALGERLMLYFNNLINIRYKNYPIRIIINRTKAGF
jgi:hypothetical protein